MKRITFAVIILNISLFFTACAHPLGQSRTELLTSISSREDRAYNETMSAFLDALNRNDENAIYALFSSRAYESDPLLKEDIHTLVEMYPDGTDEVFYGLISGSNHWYNEGSESFARSNCTLLADGSYFECSIELLYEYTEDLSQLGIVRMDFYTADEYCIYMSSEESHYNNSGLTVHNSQTLEVDFRLIDNYLYEYVYIDRQLDLAEVKEFLETCHLYEEFVKKFGVPNAYRYTAFYELPPEEGEPRYLEIYYHEKTREISCVNIVSHVKYKGTLWEAETDNTGNG